MMVMPRRREVRVVACNRICYEILKKKKKAIKLSDYALSIFMYHCMTCKSIRNQ